MNKTLGIDKAKSVWLLTAALVMIATWAIGATGWTKGITIITFVGLGSILIGTMLARSILPWFLAHLFSLIIGIGWSFWVTSRLLPANYTWLERWENLALRLSSWYLLAQQGGTSYDNLMFIFQMGLIVWLMGYLTVWFVFRSGKVWPAIIPGGLVLLINLYYAPRDITFWFILYMLVSLLLVIRFNLFHQEKVWRSEGTFFRPDISFDFLRDGFIFSALVIGFAWLTPPIIEVKSLGLFDEFQGSWRDLQNEWNRMFADLNYRDRVAFDTFGSSLKLGGPRRLTDEPVMDVQVDGLGRYWRAVVYDYYTGDGWLTRDEDKANIGPSESLSLPNFEAREAVTQTFTFYRDNATVLYAMSNPVNLDRSAKVTFNALSDQDIVHEGLPSWPDNGQPRAEEITYIRSNATVDRGESYQIVSFSSRASEEELETAGTSYPGWVTDRYLQLPDSITDRTRQLALEITEPQDNNFAKAQAIERYLRRELTYNERLATPPPNIDKVDYILFTAKEAYCDYYASSMIVMLRSLGIPARLAAGFARGTYEAEVDSFHVLNKDAHSWVEVYFPDYGWLEFEPTAAQPNIIRPNAAERDGSAGSTFFPGNEDPGPEQFPDRPDESMLDGGPLSDGLLPFVISIPFLGTQLSLPRPGGGSLIFMLMVIAVAAGGGYYWWYGRTEAGARSNIFGQYRSMVKLAGWMGVAIRPWQTPYEHAAILRRSLPAHGQEVETITDEYVYQTFKNKNGTPTLSESSSPAASSGSSLAWNRLRPAMIKEGFKRHLPRWLRR